MYNYCDGTVHFKRRKCSTSPAVGVQLERYIQYQIPTYRMKREEVKTVIFRYIFGYYNTQRINSFNAGGLPPVALRTSTGLAHHAA